jgi:hypothetical protein
VVARVRFAPHEVPAPAVGDPRFEAITRRHTSPGPYDARPLSAADRETLAGVTVDPGLRVDWVEDVPGCSAVDDLMMRADAWLLSRADYRQELGRALGTGGFGTAWLLDTLERFAAAYLAAPHRVTAADRLSVASAPAVAVISARTDSREVQVRAGQLLERLYLEATIRGVSLQPLSQLVECRETAGDLAALLPDSTWRPLQPLRIGHALGPRTRTPRRPIEDVLC